MNPINLIADGYERKARLYPALLLLSPILIIAVCIASTKLSILESLATAAAGGGGAFLLVQLARDAGKKCEETFFKRWRGIPSVAIFRHRDTRIDPITKARYHKQLSILVKGTKAPSSAEEASDPAKADEVYMAWSTYLRVHTRDTKKYSLLFQENVNYGYRRNVCGLRTLGMIVSGLSFIVGVIWFYHLYSVTGKNNEKAAVVLIAIFAIFLLWSLRFTSDWVRIAADAYAERLAESVDSMKGTVASPQKKNEKSPV